MTTTTLYPGTLQQTIGGNYATWNHLNNIKNNEYFATSYVYGESAPLEHLPNTPSKIIATNFKAQIPENSKITQIQIEYRQQLSTTMTTLPDIGAPTFTLLNLNNQTATGTAPTSTPTTSTVTFTIDEVSIDAINNQNFGVQIAYPHNENEYSGWVGLTGLKIIITYTTTSYAITSSGASTCYKSDIVPITFNVTNTNEIDYDPTIKISLGLNDQLMFLTATGTGTINQIGQDLYWKIPFKTLNSTTATVTVYYKTYLTGTFYLTASTEADTIHGKTHVLTVTNDPNDTVGETTVPSTGIVTNLNPPRETETVYMSVSDTLTIELLVGEWDIPAGQTILVHTDTKAYKYSYDGTSYTTVNADDSNNHYIEGLSSVVPEIVNLYMQYPTVGLRTVYIKSQDSEIIYKAITVHVMPDNLGGISATTLTLPTETIHRMGDGYVYTAQAYLQKTITDTTTEFIDCYRNIRMIVWNNSIPSGTSDITKYMIENAEYVSDAPESYNTYEDISVDFAYNDDYPVYVIFTSDYSVNSSLGIGLKYTTPAIIEKIVYNGYEVEGNYPNPINNLISDTNTASITVPLYQQSNSFLLSKPPLPEWYGTGEDTAVVGLQLNIDLTTADECVLYAKLHSPDGRVGTRSIVLTDPTIAGADTTVTIGGMNDLFGFDVLDIDNFNSWELELYLDNKYNSKDTATIVFNNASLTLYTEAVEDQVTTCSIDGKDLRYYGLYLIDAEIPEGLKTETKYLDITGTDAKEAYRMNIDRKTITVELGIDGCNLEDTTNTLRRVARLFINERDSLNRPIPKTVEFSHYPDLYWEYVMTEAIDHSISISDYTIKVKLVIPSGTARSKQDTVSNDRGTNLSLVKVNPVIVLTPTGTELLITEEKTGQKFTIKNDTLTPTDTITIDCENRKVTKNNNTDITASVDYSSDWFSIHGEYEFNTTNSVIQTITFNERW